MDLLSKENGIQFARFTCDCLGHVMDIVWSKSGDESPMVEFYCSPLGYDNITFWKRLKVSLGYLFGKSNNHSFWDFILRKEDIKPLKEFIGSLPDS